MSIDIRSGSLPCGVLYEKEIRTEKRPETGYVFICSNHTERECLDSRVFGLSESYQERVFQVKKGDVLFLLNYQTNRLHGVFEAITDGAMNIVPYAFGGRFPAQVRVKRKIDCPWIDKGALLPLIKRKMIGVSRRGTLLFTDRLSPRLIDELHRIFLEIPQDFHTRREATGYKAKDGHFKVIWGETCG